MTRGQIDTGIGAVVPWLLAAYVLIPPLFKAALQPFFPVDLTVLLAIPTAAIGGWWLLTHRTALQRWQVIALAAWLALAGVVTLGVLWAPDRGLGLRSAAYFVILATAPLLAAFPVAAEPARVRRFLIGFVVAGGIFVVVCVVALFTGDIGGREIIGANRLSVARALLFVPLVGMTLLAWHRFGPAQWALVAMASVAMFVAVATASRAASIIFVALGMALVLGALVRSPERTRVIGRSGALVAGTLVAFVTLSGLLPEGSPARFGLLVDIVGQLFEGGGIPGIGGGGPGGIPDPDLDDGDNPVGGSSVAQRAGLYRLALDTFIEHPVAGVGTAGFQVVANSEPGLEGHDYPHNLVLQVAAEFGLVGLLALGALAILAVRSWRPDTNVSVALGFLLGFLILNAMVSNGIYENRLLWAVWLVLIARPAPVGEANNAPAQSAQPPEPVGA